jgi:penicillin V acylase-like amidase (Ntn superfamily)
MGSADFAAYVLTQFATVDEVRRGLSEIMVVPIPEPALGGIPAPVHLRRFPLDNKKSQEFEDVTPD